MDVDSDLPEMIGPYRVLGRLGRGGMGEVLHGHDDRLDRPVALKRVLPDVREPEKALRRFRREARAVARLSHPSIVQVHDWEEGGGQHWLVMELVEGRSLDHLIAEGPLPPGRVLEIARDIASGLAEAHDAGIVHRDLKATNILINSKDRAKILDFGLAKTYRLQGSVTGQANLEAEAPNVTLTQEGRIIGTVTAMSPEQALGNAVDHRSDLFSLGTLLYEMSSGDSPFKGGSAVETLTRICNSREKPLRQLDPKIPEGVSRLVAHLLEKEPDRRPSDAHQVVAEIDRLITASSAAAPAAGDPPAGFQAATRFDVAKIASPDQPSASGGLHPGSWRPRSATVIVLAGVAVGLGLWGLTSWLKESAEVEPPAAVMASAPPAAEPTPYALYQRGMDLLQRSDRKGNVDQAIHELQKALAKDQNFAPALAGLAWAYRLDYSRGSMDSQRLDQALAAAEQAIEINEHLAFSWVSLGQVHFDMGQLDDAQRELERALELEPSNGQAWIGLGQVYEARGDLQRAEEYFSKAAEIRPEGEQHLGVLYFRTGRYEEAASAFSRYLELVPDNFRILSNLGVVYYMQGRLTEAAAQFQKALLIKADSTLYANMGTIYFTQGLYARSVSAFEQAIENRGSNYYLLWGNLGDARRWTPGQEEKAREAYLRAIQLLDEQSLSQHQDPMYRTQRALYLAKRGDCDEAHEEIGTITEHLPATEGGGWFRLAVAQEVCGRREDALAALGAALRAHFSIEEVRRDPELLDLRQDVRYHELALKSPQEPAD